THSLARFSVLPAISYNSILAAKIVDGSFNTVLFTKFIKGLLDQMQPFQAKNLVIVMDDCQIHKDPEIIKLVHSWYEP
ncbi:hypothetical protein K439DRAFT_1359096, partial [Ramaria rubella]